MPFQKGRPKTGGKSRGCKNKITKDIIGLLDKLTCNPLEGLANIAADPKAKLETRAFCLAKIARYVHPELRSVEVSGPGGTPIQHEFASATELLNSRINSLAERAKPE